MWSIILRAVARGGVRSTKEVSPVNNLARLIASIVRQGERQNFEEGNSESSKRCNLKNMRMEVTMGSLARKSCFQKD